MREVLGYEKYGAQGGDIGGAVTVQLALAHKDSLIGVHFNTLGEMGSPLGRPVTDIETTRDPRL